MIGMELQNFDSLLGQVSGEHVSMAGAVCKLLLSMVLGAMVGLERRHKG